MKTIVESINIPEGANIIFGMSHFIKTAEDLYEAIINVNPGIKFGVAFNEASGPCLVRVEGNDDELKKIAADNMLRLGCGHTFLIILGNVFPINVMPSVKACREVVNIFCATANPVQVIIAETDQGRGVMGVIDGFTQKGIETDEDIKKRKDFLRMIGYKR